MRLTFPEVSTELEEARGPNPQRLKKKKTTGK
jgi:hypothetical protein